MQLDKDIFRILEISMYFVQSKLIRYSYYTFNKIIFILRNVISAILHTLPEFEVYSAYNMEILHASRPVREVVEEILGHIWIKNKQPYKFLSRTTHLTSFDCW